MIKKIICIFSVCILIFLFCLSYMKYHEINGLSFQKKEFVQNDSNSPILLIGHGGGNLNSSKGTYKTVTNAIEAFEQNYEQGMRNFEVDLVFTADDKIVARHDWEPYLYEKYLGQKQEDTDGKPLTYKTVMNKKIFSINTDALSQIA